MLLMTIIFVVIVIWGSERISDRFKSQLAADLFQFIAAFTICFLVFILQFNIFTTVMTVIITVMLTVHNRPFAKFYRLQRQKLETLHVAIEKLEKKKELLNANIRNKYYNLIQQDNTIYIFDSNIWMGNSDWYNLFFSIVSSSQGKITLLHSQLNELENIKNKEQGNRAYLARLAIRRIDNLQQNDKLYIPPVLQSSSYADPDILNLMTQLIKHKVNGIIITDDRALGIRLRSLNKPQTSACVNVLFSEDLFRTEYEYCCQRITEYEYCCQRITDLAG